MTWWIQTSISWKKLKKTQGNEILGQNSICTSTKCIAIHVSRNVLFCGFASFWKQPFPSPHFPHRSSVYQELISYCYSFVNILKVQIVLPSIQMKILWTVIGWLFHKSHCKEDIWHANDVPVKGHQESSVWAHMIIEFPAT